MKIAGIILGSLVLLAALAGGAIAFVFFHYGRDLPDHNQLAAYEPPVMTRVHAGDGRLPRRARPREAAVRARQCHAAAAGPGLPRR